MRYTGNLSALLVAVSLLLMPLAHAQKYPSQVVTIVVTSSAGSGPDMMARAVADKLRTRWNQSVIIENRPGSGQIIGSEAVASSKPDGYTLLFTPQGALVVNKSLYRKLNYDPEALEPITVVVAVPMVLVVNASLPIKSVDDLVAYAKANPDRLNYASSGSGSTPHLIAELFKTRTGINLTHIPYKSNPAGVNDLLGGQVDVMFLDLGAVIQHIQSGKLRALAVLTKTRNERLPDVPALTEQMPGFVASPWWGMAAPAETPAAIVEEVAAGVAAALKEPDVIERLAAMGGLEAVGNTPAEAAAFMKAERKQWAEVIRAAKATVD